MKVHRPWYVGCACDRNFVQHTSVMLTSLAANGAVPEATIIVAGFGLEADDYAAIRAHSGRLGSQVRFVDVTPEMLSAVAGLNWEAHYPPAILGRIFVANEIEEAGARLLTLDSDMIVNVSVRPLFELDMLGDYVAAIHDVPRDDDPNYFNSGMMMIDIDGYRRYNVPQRALQWLAEQTERPRWPDQDALNHVVGHKWYRLDRRWNWAYCGAYYGDSPISASDYENAFIAHFTGQGKPWSTPSHAGRDLYAKYRALYQRNAEQYLAAFNHVDDNFVATAIEVLLGRQPASIDEIRAFKASSSIETIRQIVATSEFSAHALLSSKLNVAFPAGLFDAGLTIRHKLWAIERLPTRHDAAARLHAARSWAQFVRTIVLDADFTAATELGSLIAFADEILRREGALTDRVPA